MSNPLYANICGNTLAALFRMWRDAGQSANEALANLSSAISPPVGTNPALPDGWRCRQHVKLSGLCSTSFDRFFGC